MITLPLNSFRIPWNFSLSPPEAFWAPPLLPTSSLLPPKTHLQTPIFVGDEILQMGLPDTVLPPFLGCFEKWHLSLLLPFRPLFSKPLLCLEENGQRNFVSQKERKKSENFPLLKHKKTPIPPLRRKPNWIVDFSVPFPTQVREKKWSRIFFSFFSRGGKSHQSGEKCSSPLSARHKDLLFSSINMMPPLSKAPNAAPPPSFSRKAALLIVLFPPPFFPAKQFPLRAMDCWTWRDLRACWTKVANIF